MPETDPLTAFTPSKLPLDSLIAKHSERTGLDPELVRRLVGQESRGRTNAVSPKGAGGVGQLMPATAKSLGVRNVFDPDENLRGSTDYLKQQLDKFGDVNLALAAYNAGPGAVIKHGNKVPPYAETQNYVKKIGGGYQGTGYAQDPLTTFTQGKPVSPPSTPQPDPLSAFTQGSDSSMPAQNPASAEPTTSWRRFGVGKPPKSYDTPLSAQEEQQFQQWKRQYAPNDSGADYDLRGAFKAGLTPDAKTGHWPDTFKKPNHPTFSNESMYAVGADAAKAGHWQGDRFIPATGATNRDKSRQVQPKGPFVGVQAGVGVEPQSPANDPLSRMRAKYPWTQSVDMNVIDSTAKGDPNRKLEFYAADESDNPQKGKPTVEIFDKNMREADLMGEVLSHHLANVDPNVKQFRAKILAAMTPQQKDEIRGDYDNETKAGLTSDPFETWLQKQGGDSFFRGYPTGQWAAREYTPQQKQVYRQLQNYLDSQGQVQASPDKSRRVGSGEQLARDIDWHFGSATLDAFHLLPADQQQVVARKATQLRVADEAKRKQGTPLVRSEDWQLQNRQQLGLDKAGPVRDELISQLTRSNLAAQQTPEAQAARFHQQGQEFANLPWWQRGAITGATGIAEVGGGLARLAGKIGVPGASDIGKGTELMSRDIRGRQAEAARIKPPGLLEKAEEGLISYAPLALGAVPEGAAAKIAAGAGTFGAYSGSQAYGRGESAGESVKEGAKAAPLGALLGVPKSLVPFGGSLVKGATATLAKAPVIYGLARAEGATHEQALEQTALLTGFQVPELIGAGVGREAPKAETLTQVPDQVMAARRALREGINEPTENTATRLDENGRRSATASSEAIPTEARQAADRVSPAPEQSIAIPSEDVTNAMAPQSELTPKHYELQPRRVRGEGKGQFKSETAVQRESRQAQVNPSTFPDLPEISDTAPLEVREARQRLAQPASEPNTLAQSASDLPSVSPQREAATTSPLSVETASTSEQPNTVVPAASESQLAPLEKSIVDKIESRSVGDERGLRGAYAPQWLQDALGVSPEGLAQLERDGVLVKVGNGSSSYRFSDKLRAVPSAATVPAPSADVVRRVHGTSADNVDSIFRDGLRYKGTIHDTTASLETAGDLGAYSKSTGRKAGKGDAAIIVDVPKAEVQRQDEMAGRGEYERGTIKPENIVGAIVDGEFVSNPNRVVPQTPVEAAQPVMASTASTPSRVEAAGTPSSPKSSEASARSVQGKETLASQPSERIQPKGTQTDALFQQEANVVDVRQQARDGKALGEGNTVNQVAPKAETSSGQEPYRAGDKERSFPKTLAESGREAGTNLTYDAITNPESRAKAKATVDSKGIDSAMGDLRTSEGAHRTALGIELIDRATQAANEAEAKGDLPEAMRRREQAIEAANVASENLTKAGQEVQAAQIANRYTPEGAMLEAARITKSTNVPLKVEDAQKTSQYAQRVADAEKRIGELEKTVSELKTSKVAPKGVAPKTVKATKIQTARDYFAQLESDAHARLEARKKVSVKGSEAGASTIPLDIADWTIIGASKIAKGGLNYAEWQAEMIKDLGEQVRPHLDKIFVDATNQVKEKRAAVTKEMAERAATKKQKSGQTLEDALEELNGERARARQAKRDLDRHFKELELDAQKGKMDAFLSLTRDSLLSLRGLGRILSGITGKQAIDLAGKIPATASDVVLSKALGTPRTTTLPSFGTALRTIGGFAERVGPAAKAAFKGEATEIMPEAYPQPKSESPLVTYSARIMQKLYGTKESVIRSWAYPREMQERARTFAVNDAREGLIKRSQVDQRARDYVRGRVEFDGKQNQRLAQSLAEQAAKYEVQSKQIIPSMEKVRARDMVKSPTELLHSLALQSADKAVYSQPSAVSKGIGAARNAITSIAPESKVPLEIAQTTVLPFVKRPMNNIADNLLGYTGAKIPIEGYRLIKDAINKEFKPSQVKAFNEAVGKGSAGFAVMAVGAALNKSGVLSSPLDKDHPASIKAGGKYYSVGNVPVVGWLLGMGAAYQQNGVKAVPISMAKMVLEHPLLRSAKDISEGLTNLAQAKASGSNWLESAQSGASKYAGQTAARIIPAHAKIAAEASDTKERDTKGLTGPLRAGVPGLRQTLPEVGEKPRTSVINPFYSRTTTKQAEWDKKTPAEKLARTQRRRTMNEEDLRTEDEIARDKHLSELRTQARNPDNKAKVQSELQQMLSKGEISKKHGEAILNVGSNQLLEDVKDGGLADALNVYDVASPKERQDLVPIIIRKRHLLNEMSGNDRAAAENRLKKLGIPLSGQVPPREVPKKLFLQNVPQKLVPVVQSAP